jgi:hypothetical protein
MMETDGYDGRVEDIGTLVVAYADVSDIEPNEMGLESRCEAEP